MIDKHSYERVHLKIEPKSFLHKFLNSGDPLHRKLPRKFLNKLETDKIEKLCAAAESNEKLFWKLLKGQRSTTQMNVFLTDGKLITDKNHIRNMWANHFEDL